jgi:predicted nucleic acid-binding protein
MYNEILVPAGVYSEVIAGEDEAARGLMSSAWAKKQTVLTSSAVASFNLGCGETEVLSCGLSLPGHHVIVDDAAGRRSAAKLGLPFVGTGGLLICAKEKGLIASVANAIRKLVETGLWLSPEIERLIVRKAGEGF